MKKIVIFGGSGQIGSVLANFFHTHGDSVTVISRKPSSSLWQTDVWNAKTIGPWTKHLNGADAVINLSGSTINTRFTPQNRELILNSRLDSTRLLAKAIRKCKRAPAVWINASAVDLYPHTLTSCTEDSVQSRQDTGAVDMTTPDSWRFISEVVYEWEAVFNAEKVSCRKIALRTTLMLSPDEGGIFRLLLRLTQFGLGGQQGPGGQYISWMHHADYVRAVQFLIEHQEISGPVNITSPNPLPNHEFMRALRQATRMPIGLPAPSFGLGIVSALIRTEPVLILKSRRSIPEVLTRHGFHWQYPEWPLAAADLVEHSG